MFAITSSIRRHFAPTAEAANTSSYLTRAAPRVGSENAYRLYTNDALRYAIAGVVFPGASRRVVAVVVDVSHVCNAFNSASGYAICINKFTASYHEKTDTQARTVYGAG